jgi:hypothetical protein
MSLAFNLPVGQSVLFKAQPMDQNSQPMNINPISTQSPNVGPGNPINPQWSSDTPAVATVTNGPGQNSGMVKGLSAGTATISVSYTDTNGNTATQTIVVTVYAQVATTMYVILPNQDV